MYAGRVNLSLLVAFFLTLTAQEAGLHSESTELFRKIWSPYCKGVSLLECPSGQAQQLRDELRDRLSKGETSEDLMRELYSRYGSTTLQMEPPSTWQGKLSYLAPWIALFLMAFALGATWILRRKNRKSPSTSNETRPRETSSRNADSILRDLEKLKG